MAAENAGSIFAEVRIRLDQLNSDIAKASAKIDSFDRDVTTATGNTSKKASANFNAMSLAAVAASAAIVGAFRALITSTAQYQDALSGVQAATRGTSSELASLEKAAQDSGDAMATSTTDALGAVEALAKAGVSTADIMGGALPGALTLAAAGSMDVADAAEIAAATMTQFGLAGSDVTHIADLLAAGAGKAQGEVSDLSQALKQAGLVASQTGLSVDDTVGSLAAFASAGLLGSDAGTSFRTMLLRLTPQSKEAADAMKKLGINAFDSKGEFIGITAFAGQLKDRLKDLTTEQRNSALATIFGSDSIRAANVLYTQGAEGIQSWIDKVNDQGFAAETARIKLDNLAGDLKKVDAASTDAGAALGSALNPGLRVAAQFAASVLEFFSKLPAPVLAFIGVIGTLGGGLLTVAAAGSSLIPIIIGIGTAAAAALGPVGLIVSGLGALAIGAAAAGNAINDNLNKEAFAKFKDIAESAGDSGEKLAKFGETARKVEDRLALLSKQGTKVSAEGFEKLAKSAGLTNDQMAQLAIRSDRVGGELKKLAESFIDPARQAKTFADNQKAAADAIIGRYATLAEKTKTVIPPVNDLSAAIAFQNYLEAQGLITAEAALTAKIALRNAEIEKIEKLGEETGKLDATQQEAIKRLIGFNKENQADLDKIKKTRDDTAKAEQSAAEKEKSNREAIAALMTTEIQKIEAQRDALLLSAQTEEERVAIVKDAQDKIDAIKKASQDKQDKITTDGLAKQQAAFKANSDATFAIFQGLITALGAIFEAMNQKEIDALDRRYEHEKEKIENNGLTKQQALEKSLQDAKDNLAKLSDEEKAKAIADAQRELDLFNLGKDFQRQKAKLEYDAAMQSWELQVLSATAQAAQAALNAWTSTAAIPLIGVGLAPGAAALAGVIGALQVAAVVAAMPTPPKFATGGIVLGTATSGDTVPAMVNSGEMILTREQQARLFDMAQGAAPAQSGGSMILILEIDGKRVAQTTADWINSGQIRVKIG